MGELNPALHFAMDYEWWLKFMFLFRTKSIYVSPEKAAVFRIHGEAKTAASFPKFITEIATILYSLALQNTLTEYIPLLAKGFTINTSYTFKTGGIDRAITEKMIIYFLLKWCRLIYSEKDFMFAKEIVAKIPFHTFPLTAKEKNWLVQLSHPTKIKSWNLFRINRKLRELF